MSSNREGGNGAFDIWEVDMTNFYKSHSSFNKDVVNALTGPVLSIIKGNIIDGDSKPVSIEFIIKDTDNNKETKIKSNEKGEYFITLPADLKYEIIINDSNYQAFKFNFKLPAGKGETHTMTKHIILNKK